MPTPQRIHGLLAKIESAYATDPTPVIGDDGVQTIEPLHSNITLEHAWINDRADDSNGTLLPSVPATMKGRIATVNIAWRIRGSGAAYAALTDLECDPLFRACGFSSTLDATPASEKITYTPVHTAHESCTLWCYTGNKLIKVVGCRGTVAWPITTGELGVLRFQMQGIVLVDPTEVSLPSITYNATVPPPAVGMTLTVGGVTPDAKEFELSSGTEIERLDAPNEAEGIEQFGIIKFNPTFVAKGFRQVAISAYDPWTLSRAGTSQAIAATLGDTQYNRLNIASTTGYLRDPVQSLDGSFTAYDLEYMLTALSLNFD